MACEKHNSMKAKARELRLAGYSRREIARAIGVKSAGSVNYYFGEVPADPGKRRVTYWGEIRDTVLTLRKQGLSYNEIQRRYNVPKGTLSGWLKDVPLSDEQAEFLRQGTIDAVKRRALARQARRIARERTTRETARGQIPSLTARELLLMGVVAYWAEGSKSKPWARKERLRFVNSDPGMIRLFLSWLTLIGVPRDHWTLRLQIHETADVERATKFWSETTGVSVQMFKRPTLKRHNPNPGRHNLGDDYVGCLSIDVRKSTELYRQVAGWFEGVVSALGRRPIGRPLGFGPSNARSSRAGPAAGQGTLFEVDDMLVSGRYDSAG